MGRFVFSDFNLEADQKLEDAQMKFDLKMVPANYDKEGSRYGKLRLYAIVAGSQQADVIEQVFNNHKNEIQRKGIDHTLKQYVPITSLVYYHQTEMERISNPLPNMFKDSLKISYEDVYYTYLIYEPVPSSRNG